MPKPPKLSTTRKIELFIFLIFILGLLLILSKTQPPPTQPKNTTPNPTQTLSGKFDPSRLKTDAQWKKILTPQQYNILRQQGTEIPFTGTLLHNTQKGTYYSVGCNQPVFRSEQKYDSGTGWPSFWQPITPDALVLREDDSIPGQPRIEVLDKCGGHLGHVFDDGPPPTGKRYCMNSIALYFVPDKKQ